MGIDGIDQQSNYHYFVIHSEAGYLGAHETIRAEATEPLKVTFERIS